MSVTFITIQQNSNFTWDVVQKSFPKYSENLVTLHISSTSLQSEADQKAAEVAARQLAYTNKLPYIPENGSVVTVSPLFRHYSAAELRSDGGVIFRKPWPQSFLAAETEAKELAHKKSWLYIPLDQAKRGTPSS